MTKLTPSQAREKQARNLKASLVDMPDRINAVTEAPGKKAAAKADKMRQNILKSIDDGTWANNVSAVSLEQWKSDFINKGVGRIATGIDNAAPKVEEFYTQFFPHLDKIKAQVDKMPDLTLSDSIARMTKQVTEASKFKFKK